MAWESLGSAPCLPSTYPRSASNELVFSIKLLGSPSLEGLPFWICHLRLLGGTAAAGDASFCDRSHERHSRNVRVFADDLTIALPATDSRLEAGMGFSVSP